MPDLTLLTLNCFGVPMPGTLARLRTIGRVLDEERPDVACLQEVQLHRYRRLLLGTVRQLPHVQHEPFWHAPKGGLLTLSRHPFEHCHFSLYRHRGWWHTPSLADWLLHKGALMTTLQVAGLQVTVLNTHLIANYDGNWAPTNRYARAERAELAQLAELVAQAPADHLVVVAGDFNVPRGSWLYTEFLEATGLIDPLAGSMEPTYRVPAALPDRYAAAIDFVLYRPPRVVEVHTSARLRFAERVPIVGRDGTRVRRAHLSDHLGVEARFAW